MDKAISDQELQRRKWGRWTRTGAGLVAAVAAIVLLRWAIAPGVARDELRTAVVARGPVVASISATGQVVPRNEQVITAQFVSEVTEIHAQPGDRVQAGDTLLSLDSRALESSIRDSEEQLALKDNQRKSSRLAAERTHNEQVGRRDLLRIDLESRQARHQRLETLVEKGAMSSGELHEAELDVRRTQVELEQLEKSMANEQATAEAELERIDLEASIIRNQLADQQRLLAAATVRAPRDGVVTFVLDQAGASVVPGASLARVADLSSYRVEAQLSDFYAERLREGLAARVQAGSEPLDARVDAVLPTVEGGSMTLLIELDDPRASVLRPQLRVDVEVITGMAADALSLRNGPSIGENGRQFVYRIVDDEAVRTPVELGFASVNHVQILNGLSEGDEVIISDLRDMQHLERFNIE